MNFVSIASTRFQVDIHFRVVNELRKSLGDVQFWGISPDLWYAGEATINYTRNSAKVEVLARPSGIKSSSIGFIV